MGRAVRGVDEPRDQRLVAAPVAGAHATCSGRRPERSRGTRRRYRPDGVPVSRPRARGARHEARRRRSCIGSGATPAARRARRFGCAGACRSRRAASARPRRAHPPAGRGLIEGGRYPSAGPSSLPPRCRLPQAARHPTPTAFQASPALPPANENVRLAPKPLPKCPQPTTGLFLRAGSSVEGAATANCQELRTRGVVARPLPRSDAFEAERDRIGVMPTQPIRSYGTNSANAPLAPFEIQRREPGPPDVEIEILFCGVCHSDLHQARNEWHRHRLSLRARARDRRPRHPRRQRRHGASRPATSPRSGAWSTPAATARTARRGNEQYCLSFPVLTYNGPDKALGGMTYGGYSTSIVVDEAFVLRVPKGLDLAAAAPLLCAGITTYSPLRHWKVGAGPEGRRRRPRRPGPHGRQVRARDGRARRAVHHLARQGRRRPAARRPRGRRLEERERDEEARGQPRLHPRRGVGPARHQRTAWRCSSWTGRCAWSARPSSRCRSRRSS